MVQVLQVMSCNLLPLFSFSFLFPSLFLLLSSSLPLCLISHLPLFLSFPPFPLPTSFLLRPSLSHLSSLISLFSSPFLPSLPSPSSLSSLPFPFPSFLPSLLPRSLHRPGLVSSRENYSPSLWSDENPETNAHPPPSLLVKTGIVSFSDPPEKWK